MSTRGFTLIEIFIALAIFGILVAMSVPSLAGLQDHLELQRTCRELANDLRITHQMALFKRAAYTISFDSLGGGYLLPWSSKIFPSSVRFGYATGVQGPPSDPRPISDPDGISFTGNRAVFFPTGQNSLGTLYLTGYRGETLAITLTLTGRVKIWQWRNGQWK
ncbi:MAG: type II secretion system protein [Nitrospirae bacterium]|nr:type II secretion system protein [Nitrospirota bacterium]